MNKKLSIEGGAGDRRVMRASVHQQPAASKPLGERAISIRRAILFSDPCFYWQYCLPHLALMMVSTSLTFCITNTTSKNLSKTNEVA